MHHCRCLPLRNAVAAGAFIDAAAATASLSTMLPLPQPLSHSVQHFPLPPSTHCFRPQHGAAAASLNAMLPLLPLSTRKALATALNVTF